MAEPSPDVARRVARGLERLHRIAVVRYRRSLDEQAKVDFSEGLARTLALLRRMDEFSQSRYRLEARYHHVLLDEFQDTSRAQWRLVSRLVQSWGEGAGPHDYLSSLAGKLAAAERRATSSSCFWASAVSAGVVASFRKARKC